MEPKWLLWARELQAIAQTGLAFTKDAYDSQRYERLRELAAQMMAEHAGKPAQSKVCSRNKWAMPHPRLTFGAPSLRRVKFF